MGDILTVVRPLAGKEVAIEFKRAGALQTARTLVRYLSQGRGFIGVAPGRTSRPVNVHESSPFYKAGLRGGDVLVSVGPHLDPAMTDIADGRPWSRHGQGPPREETLEFTILGKSVSVQVRGGGVQDLDGQVIIAFNWIERT